MAEGVREDRLPLEHIHYRDNLLDRVSSEPKRKMQIYLDSGWRGDNYEATRSMRDRLIWKGYRPGSELFYLAFPEAEHDEKAWAARAVQFRSSSFSENCRCSQDPGDRNCKLHRTVPSICNPDQPNVTSAPLRRGSTRSIFAIGFQRITETGNVTMSTETSVIERSA